MLARTAELGDAHEHRVLAAHLAAFGPWDAATGRGVHEVEPARRMDRDELTAKHAESLDALRAGADVVFQASFFDGAFHGRADFLVRRPDGAYAVHDTKLARHAKVTALLQLAAYADQDRRRGKTTLAEVIDRLRTGLPAGLEELATLGRTLHRRRDDVLAYFDRPGSSNGPTEALNGRLEHLRGSALGFRNLTNYIARSLLETGGFRPRLHRHL